MHLRFALAISLASALFGSPVQAASPAPVPSPYPKKSLAPKPLPKKVPTGATTTTASGLKYRDLTVGKEAQPKPGDSVTVQYTGTFPYGTKFDSSRDRGVPFAFVIGQGNVIKGWDEGVMSMRVGGHRILTVPPSLGYGEAGAGSVIPPNATLLFDVELVKVGG